MMEIIFYIFGFIAILFTICVIFNHHPIYALLFLIFSFVSVSCMLFIIGADFAGIMELIVYAGAIMILFVFVVMLLPNKNEIVLNDKNRIFKYFSFVFLLGIFLFIFLNFSFNFKNNFIYIFEPKINIGQIGYILFGSYVLIVEMVSFLLLGALISVLHLSQEFKLSIHSSDNKKFRDYDL